MTNNMSKITLELIVNSINEVKTSVDNLEIRLKEHVSNEIGGLAYMVYKVEERLIDRMDGFELRMDGLDQRMNTFDTKLDRLTKRVDSVETKIDILNGRVDLVEVKLGDINSHMQGVETKLTSLDQKVDSLDDTLHIVHSDMGNQFDGVYQHLHTLEVRKFDRVSSVV